MTRQQLLFLLCVLLLLAAGILGGGSTDAVVSMCVELIACALLGVAIIGLLNHECPRAAYPALVLLLLTLIVPVLQLIPLPAGLWRSLPGHEIPDALSRLAGQGDLARPLTLDPEQTRLRALALIVPAAAFLATIQLNLRDRDRIIMGIVAFAFTSAVLGVFQMATGQFYLYSFTHFGFPVGFFANKNHQADLLLIAIPLSARALLVWRIPGQSRRFFTLLLCGFFAVAVIATQSRTGLMLLPVALVGTILSLREPAGAITNRRTMLAIAGAGILVVAAGILLTYSPAGQAALHRFGEVSEDMRPQFWQGTIVAIRDFWPSGSGLGSFVPVYDMFEDLDTVNPSWLNHAHNDYLEILLETGVAGCVLLLAYAVLLTMRMFSTAAHGFAQHHRLALTGIAILLLHSLTDYPMRTFVLLMIFAFLNGLLFEPRHGSRIPRRGSHPVTPPPAFGQKILP